MFPGTAQPKPKDNIKAVVRRTKHAGKPTKPFPEEYELNMAIEKEIVDMTLEAYLEGSKENGIRYWCDLAVKQFIKNNKDKYPRERIAGRQYMDGLPEGFKTIKAMLGFYYKRIINNTNDFVGYKHRDNWVKLFRAKRDVKGSQKDVERLRYDKLPLLASYGLIGAGIGAGHMWFVDGSGFDALMIIKEGNKEVTKKMNMMLVICAVTGKVLNARPIKSESTQTMIEFITDTYKMYGVPKCGMYIDHSSAFTSKEFNGFCKSLYTDEQLEGFGGGYDWVRDLFPGHTAKNPLFLPPANIPTAFIKAYGERMIQEIKKFMPTHIPKAYIASPTKKVSTDLSNTLDTLKKFAPLAEIGWAEFENYCYSTYEKRTLVQYSSYSKMARKLGYPIERQNPCVRNFWLFFGGNEDGTINDYRSFPREKEAYLYYYLVPKKWKHRVQNSNSKNLLVTHETILRNYYLDALETCDNTRYFIVIPNPKNPKQAYVFIENDRLRKDDRVPEKEDIYLLGIAQDATIRGREDIHLIGKMAASRERSEKKIQSKLKEIGTDGWKELTAGDKDTCHPKLNANVAALPYEAEETQLRITAPSKDIHDNPDKDVKPEPTIVGIPEPTEIIETEVIEAEPVETVETETEEIDIEAMYNDLMGIS
jgi:hypothetical protein